MNAKWSLGSWLSCLTVGAALTFAVTTSVPAQPVPGGKLDPTLIPKYVTPLVIPPVMNDNGTANNYDIEVRPFKQQILPGGIWNTINGRADTYKATKIWSYGPAADPTPTTAPDPNSQFNYPAYTVETTANTTTNVRWINGLKDPENGQFIKHLFRVDQNVHWCNPAAGPGFTDTMGATTEPYEGPVPIVTHVHGAHVGPESDGYPEAWWLPASPDIPPGYARSGSFFDDASGTNPGNLGYADYSYPNTQPATTLWYHDHALGMTRLNVYAGPAGFWLIRGDFTDPAGNLVRDSGDDSSTPALDDAVLPGPAPVAGQGVLDLNVPGVGGARDSIREIPIVIQDRSFDKNGKKLFYPKHRAFFEGIPKRQLKIPFAPELGSDVLPFWQPEAFFNVMVVNGVSWPQLEVAQDRYRFRLLNGCNSRFLNISMKVLGGPLDGTEIPFYQIGAEQGFLPQVVRIQTGEATPLPGDGTMPAAQPGPHPDQALLMIPAERADCIVDFSGLPAGTIVQLYNTAPDAPFGGFPDVPADPGTTGQVMQFVVDSTLNGAPGCTDGTTTAPENLVLSSETPLPVADNDGSPRRISLNEGMSASVFVLADIATGAFVLPIQDVPPTTIPAPGLEVVPFGPAEALLGTVDLTGLAPAGVPLKWTESGTGVERIVPLSSGAKSVWVTENPAVNSVEEWDIYNFTVDAHPIHLHLTRFEVISRMHMDGTAAAGPEAHETGYKDTVIAYPGQITRVKARFDIEGLYVWHCHIVEHEDNEMMRPYYVGGQ